MGFLGRVDFVVEKSPTDPVGQTVITQPGQLRYSRKLGDNLCTISGFFSRKILSIILWMVSKVLVAMSSSLLSTSVHSPSSTALTEAHTNLVSSLSSGVSDFSIHMLHSEKNLDNSLLVQSELSVVGLRYE